MKLFYEITERLKKSPIVLLLWYIQGRPIPPFHIYKQRIVSGYANRFKIDNLVESGTFKGDMVYGVKNKFQKIITIELSDYYFKKAKDRLKNYKHIQIIQGDSGKEIKNILKSFSQPCVFWLDGHYSDGNTAKGKVNTPVINELNAILNHQVKFHVILVDDARCFNGKEDYPKISQLKRMLKGSNYTLKVKDDVIRITPPF